MRWNGLEDNLTKKSGKEFKMNLPTEYTIIN